MDGAVVWQDLAVREVIPGYHGRFIHSERMTFARWHIDAGAPLPEHSHLHEQVVHVFSGEFELVLEGVAHRCRPGSVLVIPSNARHSGRAITDCEVMDVFSPVREDYRDGAGAGLLLGGERQ